jgi:hypothetical protein
MAVYVLDSNFFIQAHRVSYPLDIATSFWDKVKKLAKEGKIVSIDKVRKELYGNNDDLETWCRANLSENFFIDSAKIIGTYKQVVSWAMSKRDHYLPNALNEFLDAREADAFVIAFALDDSSNRIVTTQEVSEPHRRNKVKIPEVCNELNIRYVNTIEMFRELGERF